MSADRFTTWDAAYAMARLVPAERAQFEQHLAGCAACRARVTGAAATVALLATLRSCGDDRPDATSPAAAGPAATGRAEAGRPAAETDLPDTVLVGMLRAARRERRRGRVLTRSLAAATAASVVALVIALWPFGGATSSSGRPAALAFRPVAARTSDHGALTASAMLTSRSWGTQIDVHCKYAGSDKDREAYLLRVIDRAGKAYAAGAWRLAPGSEIRFTGGTEVRRERIARLQVTLPNGTPILQLAL